MTDTPVNGALLTVEEAAEYLGTIPVNTLKKLIRDQQIEHVKVGRYARFRREQLDAYIDDHTVKPHENPWGLTDGALRNLRADRVTKKSAAS